MNKHPGEAHILLPGRKIMVLRSITVIYFLLGLFPGVAGSTDSEIVVRDAWIREAPAISTVLAGYMTLQNQSDKSQSLTSVSATAFNKVMIHRTEQKDGMAHMTHQEQITIPARGEVVFTPGGYHLMLMHPHRSLRAGDQVTINFTFADKSILSKIFTVRKELPVKGEDSMKRDQS